jgi:hypothetical protein
MGLQKVGRLLRVTPPGPIKPSTQLAAGVVFGYAVPFARLSTLWKKNAWYKTVLPNQHVLTFLHPKLSVESMPVEELVSVS